MKNIFSLGLILLLSLTIISCRTTRNMKYFQDLESGVQKGKPAPPPEYLIKADDNLYIDIQSMNMEVSQLLSPSKSTTNSGGTQSNFGDASSQYLNGYQVNQKGMILLPVIGEVPVANMTEEAAKDAIQKRVGEYFKDATVRVKILTYKVTVLGEVRNPGVYYNYNKSITILDALGMANGTSGFANIKTVLVLRTDANGSKSFRLDLTNQKILSSEGFYLLPNDVVYISPDNYVNQTVNTTLFSMALAAISTTILILGYIRK